MMRKMTRHTLVVALLLIMAVPATAQLNEDVVDFTEHLGEFVPGDIVLRVFADRVRSTTREADVVVRRGGDEFVLLMPGTGREHALAVAERIRGIMSQEPVELEGSDSVTQTVSIGIATWTGVETPGDFEKRADEAMYKAKLDGRDRVQVAARPPGVPEPELTEPESVVTNTRRDMD